MIHTMATIVGDGAAHPLSLTPIKATWVQLQAPLTNVAQARVGDSLTSSARGATIPASGFQFAPSHGNANMYNLDSIYYYLANGDTLDVVYNTF